MVQTSKFDSSTAQEHEKTWLWYCDISQKHKVDVTDKQTLKKYFQSLSRSEPYYVAYAVMQLV